MIVPEPKSLRLLDGIWSFRMRSHFSTGWSLKLHCSGELIPQAQLLADYLRRENLLPVSIHTAGTADIYLCLVGTPKVPAPLLLQAGFADESHSLSIEPDHIVIEAAHPHGIARAIQSLRQLCSGQRARLQLQCMRIEDAPAMGWRGLHLDVSRHFMTAADVMRFIDLAALHKFNLFHWHLTDDQGWRLPVEGYPRLQEVAAWRSGTLIGHDCDRHINPTDGVAHGGFYTHVEIAEVVAYAACRGVHVLPEIDLPGHVQALVTAYPEFGCTDTAPGVRTCWGVSPCVLNLEPPTFRFLHKLVETVVSLFPFKYLHFGGDEAKTEQWTQSASVQQRKYELGLTNDHAIQHVFTRQLNEWAVAHGRLFIGWDEIADSGELPPEAAVMFWRDGKSGDHQKSLQLLRTGIPLVLANWSQTYLDLYQQAGPGIDHEPMAICGLLPLAKVYDWQPLAPYPADLHPLVLGAQAQVWTEYMPNRNHVDYMVYPRACALAQVLWTGSTREPLSNFMQRLHQHLPRLDRLGVCYRTLWSCGVGEW